jgi:hypothetical protein
MARLTYAYRQALPPTQKDACHSAVVVETALNSGKRHFTDKRRIKQAADPEARRDGEVTNAVSDDGTNIAPPEEIL